MREMQLCFFPEFRIRTKNAVLASSLRKDRSIALVGSHLVVEDLATRKAGGPVDHGEYLIHAEILPGGLVYSGSAYRYEFMVLGDLEGISVSNHFLTPRLPQGQPWILPPLSKHSENFC